MTKKPAPTDQETTALEEDAVWKLLGSASQVEAGPRFVEQTVRAARLLDTPAPWWKRMLSPAPLASLATSCAMIALAWVIWPSADDVPSTVVEGERAAEIAEIAQTETLIEAVEHLDSFSDNELVTLIGF